LTKKATDREATASDSKWFRRETNQNGAARKDRSQYLSDLSLLARVLLRGANLLYTLFTEKLGSTAIWELKAILPRGSQDICDICKFSEFAGLSQLKESQDTRIC
jgi:hypothetical protein